MNYSPNYNLNVPERNEQYNLDHWNENTLAIDERMKANQTATEVNATNIGILFRGLDTKNISDKNSVYFKLMHLVYPKGSLYWNSENVNPADLFGGSWSQIKDRFVLACGDTYSPNATGGSKDATLTINNMPSHSHSMAHTHKVTAEGNISGGTYSFEGSNATIGGGSHTHSRGSMEITGQLPCLVGYHNEFSPSPSGAFRETSGHAHRDGFGTNRGYSAPLDFVASRNWSGTTSSESHTHSYKPSGSVSVSTNPTFSGSEVDSGQPSVENTGSNGSGNAFSILPPYVTKYCWQRND